MKIYRITYSLVNDDAAADGGSIATHHQAFETSDGAASKRCTAVKKEFKDKLDGKVEREAIDVPTTKADLVEWLNKHASVVSAEVIK